MIFINLLRYKVFKFTIYSIKFASFRIAYILQVQAYNPREQEWSVEAPLTSARHKSCAVAMDGDAVVLTGGTGLGVGKVNYALDNTVRIG